MRKAYFRVEEVRFRTPYTMELKGRMSYDTTPFGESIVKFTGTSVESIGEITVYEYLIDDLKENLTEYLGYGPYDEEKIRVLIEKKSSFALTGK